ncbi:MAG: hypothetical protein ACI8R4_000450 [Paracoccaceae bacterium]|jgi:hypothetical protein
MDEGRFFQENQFMVFLFISYVAVFLLGMCFKNFRDSYFEWMTFRDPLGGKFWSKNWWFPFFSLLVGVLALVQS